MSNPSTPIRMSSSLLSNTTTSNFVSIPPELQTRILQNLDAVSLVRCAMTCVYLNDIVKNSSRLMYIIQLHLDGLEDCGTALPNADSVARLLERRRAWLSLEWTGHIAAEIPFNGCADAWDLVAGAVVYADEGKLEIIQLPTSKDDRGRKIGRALGGLTPLCVTMDPTQDLMVFLQNVPSPPLTPYEVAVAEIHVRAISSGIAHPLALQSPLEFNGESPHGYLIDDSMDPVLQIAHNLLAFSFAARKTRILIWDWTTSELLLDSMISFDRSFPSYIRGSTINLLNSSYFLFACADGSGSIRLYKLDRSVSVDKVPAIHLATLHLPPLRAGSDIRDIAILTGPIQAHPLPHTPLVANDEDRLHVLWIMYLCGDEGPSESDEGQIGLLFTHQRVFTKYIAQHARLGGPALNIPWAEWGPRNTRLISPAEGLVNSYDKRYVHGQRAAFPGRGLSSTDIEIFDFSLAAVLSAKGYIPAPSASSWELSSSTRVGPLHDCPFFADNFSTYLPYVHITRDVKVKYLDVLIYADGLVCEKYAQMSNGSSTLAHVYAI
ncbi:hypothetical protein BJ912DRAFT_159947 [Pholiota molesta]|nr:hypothetical protein BJ912DRAFT_159947 [Pholiota molesta]